MFEKFHFAKNLYDSRFDFVRPFKLGYPPNFNFLGKPLLGEKYVEGKKKEKERKRRIMPILVATTSAFARKRACPLISFAPKFKIVGKPLEGECRLSAKK